MKCVAGSGAYAAAYPLVLADSPGERGDAEGSLHHHTPVEESIVDLTFQDTVRHTPVEESQETLETLGETTPAKSTVTNASENRFEHIASQFWGGYCTDFEDSQTNRDINNAYHEQKVANTDCRIDWSLCQCYSWERAEKRIEELMMASLHEVAEFKVGVTSQPCWRMTALPKSASTVQPHYLNFSAMQVLFIGSGVHAFELEAHLIKNGLTSSKCKNIKPGKDGQQTAIMCVYVVFNSLDLAVAHCNAHKRKPFVKCAKCASRKLDLIGYEGVINSVCACSVRWSYNSIKDSGSQARFAYICDASG